MKVVLIWDDCDWARGSNEICTAVYKSLQDVDKRKKYKGVNLYCDSCLGQNKNQAMLPSYDLIFSQEKCTC